MGSSRSLITLLLLVDDVGDDDDDDDDDASDCCSDADDDEVSMDRSGARVFDDDDDDDDLPNPSPPLPLLFFLSLFSAKSIDDDEWGHGNEVIDADGCTNRGRLRRRHHCCSCDVEEREPVNDNEDIDGRRDATKNKMTLGLGDFMVLVDIDIDKEGRIDGIHGTGQSQSTMYAEWPWSWSS